VGSRPPLASGEVVRLIVKQSRPQLRTRQAWFSDVSRIHREEDVQRLLAAAFPGHVPQVLFSARDDYAYVMEHAHPNARPWKQILLQGGLDADIAREAGRLLRGIHSLEVRETEKFLYREVFRQLRIDPFYRQIQAVHPDLAGAVQPLIDAMETAALGLCHGDFSPKNLLVAPGLMLVDHETAHLGEPAMDIGFFASHLLLKAVRSPERAEGFVGLVREALAGYGDEAVIRRALGHLGVCLLARVDGTSPVDYLPEEGQKEYARRLGRQILLGGLASWDEALDAVRAGRT
jgi:5-methylthioribose kinase